MGEAGDRIADLKLDVNAGFERIEKHLDKLVTKGELNATVERLDAQHATLRKDHDALKADADVEHAAIRRETAKQAEDLATGVKWWVGIALTILGFAVTFLSPLLRDWMFH